MFENKTDRIAMYSNVCIALKPSLQSEVFFISYELYIILFDLKILNLFIYLFLL